MSAFRNSEGGGGSRDLALTRRITPTPTPPSTQRRFITAPAGSKGNVWVALSRPGSGLGVTFGLCYHGRARDFGLCYHGSVGCGEAVFRIFIF